MPKLLMRSAAHLARRICPTCSPMCALALLALLLLPGSCGFGSAAVASTTGNGQENANPVVSDVSVVDSITPTRRAAASPAQVRFRLTDGDGDASSVSIDYSTDNGASFRPITTTTTLTDLAPDAHEVAWNYLTDLGDESFRSDVQLRVTVAGGNSLLIPQVAMGNDAPQIDPAAFVLPAAEPEGNVQVGFAVQDSAGDQVDIRVEFNDDDANGFPEESWELARSVGVDASTDTPPFALNNLEPPAGGQPLSRDFFWESDFEPDTNSGVSSQMAFLESDVKLRFTARDAFGAEGPAVETDVFRIDNNAVPRADLDEGAFLLGFKDRGNIPIRFKIFDPESDAVQVAIQWKSAGEVYPTVRNAAGQTVDLATLSAEELRNLLEDPARAQDRRDAQLAREAAPAFQGRLGALNGGLAADEVRLAEVAGSQAGLLAMGIEGRTLEVLRSASLRTIDWGLTGPMDVHILRGGIDALILEQGADPNSWQVRELDLATGEVGSTLAQGSGAPKSMDADPMDRVLFVGSSTRIFRFQMFTGVALGDPIIHNLGDGLRCLAALGDQVVLATGDVSDGVSIDGQLRRFDFSPGVTTPDEVLLSGLAKPWGLALDPLRTTAVYLAERGFVNGSNPPGRVVAVDLDQMILAPIPALVRLGDQGTLGATPFPNPTSIALDDGGRELLAVTEWNNIARLRRVPLRSPRDLSQPPDGRADPFVEQVADLNESIGGLVTGPDRLRVVTLPASNLLMIGGGVAQRRPIQAYDPATQVAMLDGALDPVPAAGERVEWRVQTPLKGTSGAPDGMDFSYVWDSSEVPDSSGVELRVIAQDADPGIPGSASAFKSYRTDYASSAASTLITAPGLFPFFVTAADLDGDGDLDLATGSNNTIEIFFQTSPGSFAAAATPLQTSGDVQAIAAADLDGDGDIDLVAANSGFPGPPNNTGNNELELFFQRDTQPGVFEPATTGALSTGLQPRSVAAADLDGDGDIDLVSANEWGDSLTLFFQKDAQPGVFEPAATGPLSTGTRPTVVIAADLDGDGDLDLASAHPYSDSLTLFFQKDSQPGVFEQAPDTLPTGSVPWSVVAADLDGDGDSDLAVANLDDSDLTLFFQASPGSFVPAPDTLPSAGVQPRHVAAADLDGDGDTDLVTADFLSQSLTLFFQASPGDFTPSAPLSLNSNRPIYVAATDLDGDGDMDLVSANQAEQSLTLVFQANTGDLAPAAEAVPLGHVPVDVIAADLDGDGDTDLAAPSANSDILTLQFQTIPGGFTPAPAPLVIGTVPTAAAAADLDGDGDVDLVAATGAGDELRLFFQKDTEPGAFEQAATGPLNVTSPISVAAADLDGDGDVDLVSANFFSNDLMLFFQKDTEPGTFEQGASTLPTGTEPRHVVAADLDGDGDVDLVSANQASNSLTLFFQKNMEPGAFEQAATGPLTSAGGPWFVAVADLDGDGDMDLVSANQNGDNLTLFFQTSPGDFTQQTTTLPVGVAPRAVTAADLDGDGDMDLVSGGINSNNLTLYLQKDTEPGAFEQATATLPVGSARAVVAADLDGDGDLDLVAADQQSSALKIFSNGK